MDPQFAPVDPPVPTSPPPTPGPGVVAESLQQEGVDRANAAFDQGVREAESCKTLDLPEPAEIEVPSPNCKKPLLEDIVRQGFCVLTRLHKGQIQHVLVGDGERRCQGLPQAVADTIDQCTDQFASALEVNKGGRKFQRPE